MKTESPVSKEREDKKVLVVEDDPYTNELISNLLGTRGFNVISVSSGEEAVSKAMEIKPTMILMDIVLKGSLDGFETARHIKIHSNIPVIYTTGNVDKLIQQNDYQESVQACYDREIHD